MDNIKFSPISWISLICTYASYLFPFVLNDGYSVREVLTITFLTSLIFLTIFCASIFTTLNKLDYQVKCMENSLTNYELRLDIIKEQGDYLLSENKTNKSLIDSLIQPIIENYFRNKD